MQHRTWFVYDRSAWGPGPWQDEPDKEQWTDSATRLACLIVRSYLGSWCGYVGVPEGHPWHGQPASVINRDVRGIYGDITHADACQRERPEGMAVCHVPEAGEPESLWWAGFHCAHGWDYMPALAEADSLLPAHLHVRKFMDPATYRDAGYVRALCARLASFAAKAGQPRFTCPACLMTSYHPEDIRRGYCANCHDWTGANASQGH
jgi:hypothetical protein